MAVPVCRVLPSSRADGAHQMAADEVLLESAAAGVASLRFYEWSEPTLSLGYFQPASVRNQSSLLAALPFVRRPTGGLTLVHDRELTYALALPAGPPWQSGEPRSLPWLRRMHRILAGALRGLGVSTESVESAAPVAHGSPLCFHALTPGDLTVGGGKVVGSAQRRMRGALLQHGAVLLGTSPWAPSLPGIREATGQTPSAADVAGAIQVEWERETGWHLVPQPWTQAELQRIAALAREKYGTAAWNCKR